MGWQSERIGEIWGVKEEEQEQGEEYARVQPSSHTASHTVRVKVRCKEIEKGKSPEVK